MQGFEWCWVDEKGREMTPWNGDSEIPWIREVSDKKGAMKVVVRMKAPSYWMNIKEDFLPDGLPDPDTRAVSIDPKLWDDLDQMVLAEMLKGGNEPR